MLSGPPGCGKTTLPYALGQKIKSPVYTLRIGENGVTLDNLKSVIEDIKLEGLRRQVNEEQPLILFLDEAETMFPNRKGADLMHNISNSSEKTPTAIDAMQNLNENGILCIAATNVPECVDQAMKRASGRLNQMEIGMPTRDEVIRFIEAKYVNLKEKASEIACIFGNTNSKLSFANIKGILDELVKTYDPGNYKKWSKELKQAINKKAKSMNAKPLESGLTQIGKALEEIKEAIEALKDEGVSAQLAEFKPYLENLAKLKKLDNLDNLANLANLDNLEKLKELEKLADLHQLKELKEAIEKLKEEGIAAQLKNIDQHIGEHLAHLDKLDKLESLDSISSSLDAMRKALGEVQTDEDGKKYTLVNMLETLCAKLQGLENLNKIEELAEAIKSNTEQNGELVANINNVLTALQTTMHYIESIAESNKDLMDSYEELTKSVAEALNNVSSAVDKSAKANGDLAAAIDTLAGTQAKIQKLLGEIKDKLPEKQEGEGGTSTEVLNGIYKQLESLACSIRVMQRGPIKQYVLQGLTNYFKQCPLALQPDKILDFDPSQTLIDLFCAPLKFSYNNTYVSMLTCILSACLQIAYPHWNENFKYKKPNSDFTLETFYSANDTLRQIQHKIDKNQDIQQLNTLLKNVDPNAFRILLNTFDWSDVSRNQDDKTIRQSFWRYKSSITYDNTNNTVKLSPPAQLIVKNAFTALINIVFEAWEIHSIDGNYNRL